MNCPRCKIELEWSGWVLSDNSDPYHPFENPSAGRSAPRWTCPECEYWASTPDDTCADCGDPIEGTPIYWCGTSARCQTCHQERMSYQ